MSAAKRTEGSRRSTSQCPPGTEDSGARERFAPFNGKQLAIETTAARERAGRNAECCQCAAVVLEKSRWGDAT
eukprot:3569327-Alexandrium_andersonii.AAC.1